MKRSPLRRLTPLNRGSTRRRRTRINPVSAKRAAQAGDRAACREAVIARSRGLCEIGPRIVAVDPVAASNCRRDGCDVHEIKKRSRGGSTIDPDNCLYTCRPCHEFTEREPAKATAAGVLAPSWS